MHPLNTLIVALTLLTGCAGSMATLAPCPTSPSSLSPEGKVLVGRHDGGDSPAGRQVALGDALRLGLQELGVNISSEMVMQATEQEKTSGGASTSESSQRIDATLMVSLPEITVRGVQPPDYCRHKDGNLGAVAVVPPREWQLLARQHRGETRVEVDCQGPVPAACDTSVLDAVQEIANKAGLRVKDGNYVADASDFQSAQQTMAMGDDYDVAYVLWVQVIAKEIPGGTGDEVYIGTRPSAVLQQTRDGVKLQAWTPADPQQRYKVGGILEYDPDRSATARKSILKALRGDDFGEGGMLEGMEAWEVP